MDDGCALDSAPPLRLSRLFALDSAPPLRLSRLFATEELCCLYYRIL